MLEDQEDSPGRSAIDRLCTKTLLERGRKKGEILCVHPCGKWKVMPGSSELRKTSCVVKQAFLFRAGMPAKLGEAWLGRAGSRRGGLSLGTSPHPFPGQRCWSPCAFVQMAPSHHLPSKSREAFSSLAHAADTWLSLQVADSCAFTREILQTSPRAKGKGCAALTGCPVERSV